MSQLLARLRLSLKRKFLESFHEYFNRRYYNRKVKVKLDKHLPKPVFESRSGFFSESSKEHKTFSLTFLNKKRSCRLPLNWHEKELESGTRLWKLNLHYMEFLEEVDSDWFQWLTADWIKQNAPYKEKYWLDSWNSFALSIRVVVWMQQLSVRQNELDENFISEAVESIYKQLLFLERNLEKDLGGNHLIKNMKALAWGASFFKDDINTGKWKKLANTLLNEALDEQILSDGMHYERSPAYHCQVLADLIECYEVLDNHSAKTKLRSKLLMMGEALTKVVHPDQKISLFNDGGLNMAYSPDKLIAALQKKSGFVSQTVETIRLKEAGYFGLNKNNSYLLFDAGKIAPDHLPAHGHGDIFSFEWSINNERIFIDKGVFEYNKGEKRRLSRSTQSHNTVNIAGKDQCEFWNSFRVARRANVFVEDSHFENGSFSICAEHDGYRRLKGRPVHQRSLDFNGTKLRIADTIKGGDELNAEARFLLAPSVEVWQEKDRYILSAKTTKLFFETDKPVKIAQTTWYPDFGVEQKCYQLIVSLGQVPCNAAYYIEVTDG